VVEQSHDAIFIYRKSRLVFVNNQVMKMTGYTKDELLKMDIWDIIHTDDHAILRNIFPDGSQESDPSQTYEIRLLTKNGEIRSLEIALSPLAFNGTASVLGSARDITERKTAEEALKQSEEKYRILFNNLDDAIFLHLIENGLPGRIIEVNDTTCTRLGYAREELLALTPLQINDPAYPGDLAEIMRRLLEEKHVFFEWAHLTKNGTRIPVEINAHLFTLRGEEVVISIVRDLRLRGGT